jgi:hypothetical protein
MNDIFIETFKNALNKRHCVSPQPDFYKTLKSYGIVSPGGREQEHSPNFIFFFLAVLVFELGALHLLGSHSTA